MIWLRVSVYYNPINELEMKNTLSGNFRFSIWRDSKGACSCECQEILDEKKDLSPNEDKEAIIVVMPSVLSLSFSKNEHLFWGATQMKIGTIIVKEILHIP